MTSMKNYGTRTLVGNWYEERITLDAHQKLKNPNSELRTRDMTVDVHIKANEEAPKMFMNEPFKGKTTYSHDTSPKRLEKRSEILARIYTADHRRRLQGTASMAQETLPGSTMTSNLLSHQFHDPNKTRFKTVYQKSYNIPEFEATRSANRTAITNSRPPRITALTDTWDPTWKT
ncbi:hypothetical protein TRFO_30890 [Tritrichomonas foetus]|uniref:Uncharacterized protein n=1 Tax=Tritrichomonas foetus TaxID=1144522 RepID=A0A1J4JSP3_9EUKA|nr:hypothetical protein TRFO_30890 [Tritrichomonas foetus]|eukprot:OHT02129.1 hypothetical protein TRFO_30890 [Tritrichomonas foetus]